MNPAFLSRTVRINYSLFLVFLASSQTKTFQVGLTHPQALNKYSNLLASFTSAKFMFNLKSHLILSEVLPPAGFCLANPQADVRDEH